MTILGKTDIRFPRISFWRTIVAAIFAAGIYAMYARFALGFSVATNLTDPQPWGLWVGLTGDLTHASDAVGYGVFYWKRSRVLQ